MRKAWYISPLGWVSSVRKFVDEFEIKLTFFTGAKNVIALTNGTVALDWLCF